MSFLRGANPDFSANEILYQLRETKAAVMIAHPDCFSAATTAAREYGLPPERVVLFNADRSYKHQYLTVDDIVQHGRENALAFQERKLNPGEAKTKLAFLSFSSGTTGRPKVGSLGESTIMSIT
jgi:long-subunit acyl-CoA synthetase (AMP-forming)